MTGLFQHVKLAPAYMCFQGRCVSGPGRSHGVKGNVHPTLDQGDGTQGVVL